MDEKIKKLAIKVEGLVKYFGTPQDTYDNLVEVAKNQREYFNYLGPENFVKLALYIYSLKETKGFELAEKWINNLAFAELLTTEGNKYTYHCDECGGDGYVNCDNCDRTGNVECDECEGTGEENCYECDGDGKIVGDEGLEDCGECGGTGNVECGNCDGAGEVTCDYCSGNGEVQCEICDGSGEIESNDEVVYSMYFIMTWNKNIKDACELKEEDNEPAMSEYDFDRLRDNYVVLFWDDNYHGPLDVIENEMYCTAYSDEPNLTFTSNMKVDLRFKRDNARHLFQ